MSEINYKLADTGSVSVFASRFGFDWLNPELTIEYGNKGIKLSTDAGEFENEFGEFVVDKENFTEDELSIVERVIETIADETSITEFKGTSFVKFTLRQTYMDKLGDM